MKLLRALGLIWFLSALIWRAADVRAQDKIRLGLSSATAMNTTNWVAEERGFFRKYGLDAEVIITGQGGVPGMSALLAGDIQLLSGSGDLMIASALRGGETMKIKDYGRAPA